MKKRSRHFPIFRLMPALFITAFFVMIATYISITRHVGTGTGDGITSALLIVLAILVFCLTLMILYRVLKLIYSLMIGSAGSLLQIKLVVVFSLIAVLPAAIVSLFSALFFNLGIESWFDERVGTALDESVRVAQTYLDEHKYTIRGDAIAMAEDIDREINQGEFSKDFLANLINTQTLLRSLSEAVLFQPGHVIAASQLSFALTFEHIPAQDMDTAERGDVVVTLDGQDKVRALIKLKSLRAPDTYLLIGRLIDNKVMHHMDMAGGSVQQYRQLKRNINSKQTQFTIAFIILSVLLLLTAVWYGMYFASRLIYPITRLVNVAERVRAGDLSARVTEGAKNDEIATLGRAFNRMTSELQKQRTELVEANRQIDARRRFSEAVLSGVSAGILAIAPDRIITLSNPVAGSLLLLPPEFILKGLNVTTLVPEFSALFDRLLPSDILQINEEITIKREHLSHVLHVRIGVERSEEKVEGYIITFDDITDLVTAQRMAAWSDVARRVAHEIKNPLTPIQLAAERLKKKYLPQITTDADSYVRYVDTITKHVGDIGKIVEEFVNFARMPSPVLKQEDVTAILRKAIFSEQTAHNDVVYQVILPSQPMYILCDEQQLSRVFLNIMKNAAESLEGKPEGQRKISIDCILQDAAVRITIRDNGTGFPPDKITRLFEPYMTTRAKGTGLGLAIVKKIIDDHKGQILLENHPEGGAFVTIILTQIVV